MANRRNLIKTAAIGLVVMALNSFKSKEDEVLFDEGKINKPIVISTWNFGVQANGAAWEILKNNGRALDAGVSISSESKINIFDITGNKVYENQNISSDKVIKKNFENGFLYCKKYL